jgi:hypothetical protein
MQREGYYAYDVESNHADEQYQDLKHRKSRQSAAN